jgi:hypothetical protein
MTIFVMENDNGQGMGVQHQKRLAWEWLGDRDSNPDRQSQSLQSYH